VLSRRIGRARGIRRACRAVWIETKLFGRHQSSALTARLPAGPMKIQVGSGSRSKPGWINVDLFADADVRLDLREPLPFPDRSAETIYGEHVFEHLAHPVDTHAFLRECLRILRPGGALKLAVPDAGAVVRAYVDQDAAGIFEHARTVGWHPPECRTAMDHVNYTFRQGDQHQYAWDAETLLLLLSDRGFERARERMFDAALDSEDRQIGGLLVEAFRPT
jgi:predicted SAM-dependent methyltransferase